ncbi:ATP-binding protein [Patescibacteria group bacterium]|nr:ATP-binding protein [Patescibacteria group bacterium]
MRQINEQEILNSILAREESRNFEFKPGFQWTELKSRKLKEEVIKSIVAMSNTPSGGDIVLGIVWNQRIRRHEPRGVNSKHLTYFTENYEQIEQQIHKICSQTPDFEIQWGEARIEKGKPRKRFIRIRVTEFSIYPILTIDHGKEREDTGTKDFVIKEDTLYVRTKKATWSSRKATWKEFEEVIRLTADKYRKQLKVRGYVKLDSLSVRLKEEREDYE